MDMSYIKKELRDQSAHMVAVLVALAPAAYAPGVASFMFAGFVMGLTREVTELRNPVTSGKLLHAVVNSKLDLAFWTLGAGLTAYFIGA